MNEDNIEVSFNIHELLKKTNRVDFMVKNLIESGIPAFSVGSAIKVRAGTLTKEEFLDTQTVIFTWSLTGSSIRFCYLDSDTLARHNDRQLYILNKLQEQGIPVYLDYTKYNKPVCVTTGTLTRTFKESTRQFLYTWTNT